MIDTNVHFERVIEVYRNHDIIQHRKGALTWYSIGRSSERHFSQAAAQREIDRRLKDSRR